jgi:hypothetical protein
MGLKVGGRGVKIPAEARDFAFFHTIPNDSVAHPDAHSAGTRGSYPIDKAAMV